MIDWRMLSKAIEYYETRGYRYVEVPWMVSEKTHRLTCLNVDLIIRSDVGALVGSAEQSFLELDRHGHLLPGRWVACTPCFRPDEVDEYHQKGFMKVELYVNHEPTVEKAKVMLDHAYAFFNAHAPGHTAVVQTGDDTWDIEIGGIEVGSYGYREADGTRWVYGTGIAEPRFSTASAKVRQSFICSMESSTEK